MTLAKAGRIRRVQLLKHFGDGITESRTRTHPALLTVKWALNGELILALNPWFPLARELRDLLLAMGSGYTLLPTCDVPKHKWKIPLSARQILPHEPQAAFIFSTPTRTLTLLTLDVLGGKCAEHLLLRCVPGGYITSLRRAISYFVSEGILERNEGIVTFASSTWMPQLRKLLRAYGRYEPIYVGQIKHSLREGVEKRKPTAPFQLMGTGLTQRILTFLAANGPVRFARLWAAMKSKSELSIALLETMGIVTTLRSGQARSYSLNADYPVYRELRAFLQALGTMEARERIDDVAIASNDFAGDRLFGTEMRTVVLLAVAATGGTGLDGSSLGRLFSEYDPGKLKRCLYRFEGLGIIERRLWKSIIYFCLSRKYSHYAELRRLLEAMNRVWPEYAVNGISVLRDLQPPNRRAMEKGAPPRTSALE